MTTSRHDAPLVHIELSLSELFDLLDAEIDLEVDEGSAVETLDANARRGEDGDLDEALDLDLAFGMGSTVTTHP